MKKRQIVGIVSVVIIAFLFGTMLSVNFLTMAEKEEETSSPPAWPVKAATETFIVFDHEFIAGQSSTEGKTIDVDGYKTVHVLFAPGLPVAEIFLKVAWKFETPDGTEYIVGHPHQPLYGIYTFEVESPTLCIRIWNNEIVDVDNNTVIVYAQG